MKHGALLLTSTGFSSQSVKEKFKSMIVNNEDYKVALITTAAENNEENKYCKLAKQQFIEIGLSHITFVDLEKE